MSADMMALSALITSAATLIGVIAQLINSIRYARKIDATHDIAVQTLSATGRVYVGRSNVRPNQS
jgi:hypothetical protein